jgi:hypothetical protein
MSGSRTLMYETALSSSSMLLWSSHLRTGNARILGGVDRFAAERLQEGERKRLDLTDRGLAVRAGRRYGTREPRRALPRPSWPG